MNLHNAEQHRAEQHRAEQHPGCPDGRPFIDQPRWRQDFPIDDPEDHALARREFTKFLAMTSGAFVVGQGWIGLMSLLKDKQPLPELRIADDRQVGVGDVVEFRYPTDHAPCLLVRLPDHRLVAYGQQCSHLSCAVIPRPEQGHLHCPCHNGYFEINEGRPTAGPPRRPLPRIHLEVRDGFIYAIGVELRTV